MKKIIMIVMLMVCTLALTGCEKSNYEKAVSLYEEGDYDEAKEIFVKLGEYEDSATMVKACDYSKAVKLYEAKDYDNSISIFESIKEYEDSIEYIDKAKKRKIVIESNSDSLNDFCHSFYHIKYRRKEFEEIIDILKDNKSVKSNRFVNELLTYYDELKFEEQSELSQDWLELYLSLCFWQELPYDTAVCNVRRAWISGYVEEDGLEATPKQSRILVLEAVLEKGKQIYILHSSEEHDDTSYYYIELLDDFEPIENVLGIDKNKENGICTYTGSVHNFFKDFKGVPYKKIDNVLINEMTNYYGETLEFMQIFKEEVYDKYVLGLKANSQEAQETQQTTNAEPAIGMTKAQVISSTWGSPDKRNIDEYEWGVEEQWVYENKGYIYFEDGVVTAISHR